MPIQSPNLYNAALAGIGGGIGDGRSLAPLVSVASAVEAAALAVDAAIGAVVGGGSPAQSAIVEALCYAMFSGRPAQSAVQSTYTAEAASIATAYSQITAKLTSAPAGFSKVVNATFGPTATPGAANTTIVDAAFAGGSAFLATIQRLGGPSTGTNTVDAIQAYAADAIPSVIGAVTLVLSSSLGYGGSTEPVAIQVMR